MENDERNVQGLSGDQGGEMGTAGTSLSLLRLKARQRRGSPYGGCVRLGPRIAPQSGEPRVERVLAILIEIQRQGHRRDELLFEQPRLSRRKPDDQGVLRHPFGEPLLAIGIPLPIM